MIESLLISLIITYFLIQRRRRKSMDSQIRDLIESETRVKESAIAIKRYLHSVVQDEKNDVEPFSDLRLQEAAALIREVGPGAFYWMTHIAAQLASVSAAQVNKIPTNVDAELGNSATPVAMIDVVVRV